MSSASNRLDVRVDVRKERVFWMGNKRKLYANFALDSVRESNFIRPVTVRNNSGQTWHNVTATITICDFANLLFEFGDLAPRQLAESPKNWRFEKDSQFFQYSRPQPATISFTTSLHRAGKESYFDVWSPHIDELIVEPLTYFQWSEDCPHSAAAFVLPGHPSVKHFVSTRLPGILSQNQSALNLAESHDSARSKLVSRIQRCLVNEYAPFYEEGELPSSTAGQEVRLPHDLLKLGYSGRVPACCLDISCCLAGIFEAAHLDPVLAFTRDNGMPGSLHVLVGFRRHGNESRCPSNGTVSDSRDIAMRYELYDPFRFVSNSVTIQPARKYATHLLEQQQVAAVVDVKDAREIVHEIPVDRLENSSMSAVYAAELADGMSDVVAELEALMTQLGQLHRSRLQRALSKLLDMRGTRWTDA